MGRIMPSFIYQETVSALQTELKAALVDPEQAAMGNSTLPTVSDIELLLNIMASIHHRIKSLEQ